MVDRSGPVPAPLRYSGASAFWTAIVLTGAATGLGAIALTVLLEIVQRAVWGSDRTIFTSRLHQ